MNELLLNQLTEADLAAYKQSPSHALLLSGPTGSGKRSVAISIGSELLGIDTESFPVHAYSRIVSSEDGVKAIGIETVRELEHMLSLKVPSKQAVNRVIVIEDAQLLTIEAQNALLKTIEEPPAGTVLLLITTTIQSLLPTIRSRSQHIAIKQVASTDLEKQMLQLGFEASKVKRAIAMSGGLVGLTHALLSDADHPLLQATTRARELLGLSTFERLASIDELAKSKIMCTNVLYMMQQMALISLRSASGASTERWQRILVATRDSLEALNGSAQVKIVLSNYFLNI